MNEMERLKEGEQAPAIWTIAPAYGGYYKEQSFDTWDADTNTWKQVYQYTDVDNAGFYPTLDQEQHETISVTLPANQPTRIPVPYTRCVIGFLKDSTNFRVQKDQNGDLIVTAGRPAMTALVFGSKQAEDALPKNPQAQAMASKLTETTQQKKIEEVAQKKRGNIARARALASYTMRHLQYSNDSSYNALYENHQDGYIGAIDQFQKADCDVANTYFAALCSELDIPVRHVTGHMVKGKDNSGNARITSGTGHAWTEVWDETNRTWVRVDATPLAIRN